MRWPLSSTDVSPPAAKTVVTSRTTGTITVRFVPWPPLRDANPDTRGLP